MINKNRCNKLQFIQHITEMNAKPLKEILEERAFKKHSNNSFLEKLNEVFVKLKANGNTQLRVNKGTGICACNKGKKVFCFVGNKTKDYFTLSYQENEDNYHNFSKSCSEVLYKDKFELNEFYYFSINPEDTLEYKNHQKQFNPLQEYKAFSSQKKCSIKTIELWLKKYNQSYNDTVKLLENNNLNSVEVLLGKEFEILYGKLNIVSLLYKKEDYFKKQLEDYNNLKDSVLGLKEWFDYQVENKNKYQLFSDVFYDNRTLTHYSLKIDELTLNPEDFKYTLEYLAIIENSKAIVFKGVVKMISDLEVFTKTPTSRAYSKRKIVLSIDDFCCSEYQITFSDERIKHIDNLSEGQFVKVSARLTGGELENSGEIKKFNHNLYGWNVEKLNAKPKVDKNKEEMGLYQKYVHPLPF